MAGRICCWGSDVIDPGKSRELFSSPSMMKAFSLDELRKATKNFALANVIGKGSYGTVYKGKLRDEQGTYFLVAVKRYHADMGKEFQVEMNAVSKLNHRNIVKCLGFCSQKDEKLLVFELAHHGSLYSYLHGDGPNLSWPERLTIALGIAEGLKYLRVSNIVHRDPNSMNILLDKGLVPKVSGFCLALKAFRIREEEVLSIPIAGTRGYVDPEYRSQGIPSTAIDVYVFGVVLMELITGEPPVLGNDALLVNEMQQRHEGGSVLEFVDPDTVRPFSRSSVKIAAELAIRCTRNDSKDRPRLHEVLSILEEALRIQARSSVGRASSDFTAYLLTRAMYRMQMLTVSQLRVICQNCSIPCGLNDEHEELVEKLMAWRQKRGEFERGEGEEVGRVDMEDAAVLLPLPIDGTPNELAQLGILRSDLQLECLLRKIQYAGSEQKDTLIHKLVEWKALGH